MRRLAKKTLRKKETAINRRSLPSSSKILASDAAVRSTRPPQLQKRPRQCQNRIKHEKRKDFTSVDVELEAVIMVEVKVKEEINEQSRKGNDGGHETKSIEMEEIDEEAYDGGKPTEDAVLNDEETVV